MQRHLLFILLSLPMLPACDDNVDAEYKGERLLSLSGKVLAPANDAAPTGDLKVVLVWQRFATDGDWFTMETADVGSSFPAAFDLDVYNPPSEAALNHFEEGDPGVAIALVLAAPAELAEFGEEQVKGAVEDHVLAYAPADIAGDTPLGGFLGGPMTAGFHLLRSTPATEEDFAGYEACFEQDDNSGCEYPFARLTPAPIDTLLSLVLGDLETLNVPNFT